MQVCKCVKVKILVQMTVRRVYLSDKAKAILKARMEQFDGDFLFSHNEKNGTRPVKDVGYQHRSAIAKLILISGFTTAGTRSRPGLSKAEPIC